MSENSFKFIKKGQIIPSKRFNKLRRLAKLEGANFVGQFSLFDDTFEVTEVSKAKQKKETEKGSLNVEETKANLMKLETVEEIEKAIENETRKNVLEFANELINDLKK